MEINLDWFQEARLVLPAGLPFDVCQLLFDHVQRMERNAGFWLGDLGRYVLNTHPEKFSQLLDATGYAKHTVQNAMSAAEAIEPSRRRERVPFSHHAAVAGLPPEQQNELLERAEATEMTLGEIRGRARHLRSVSEPDPDRERKCYTAVCEQCGEDGPTIICKPGHTDLAMPWLNRWLTDHDGHEVRIFNDDQHARWSSPRSGPAAKVG